MASIAEAQVEARKAADKARHKARYDAKKAELLQLLAEQLTQTPTYDTFHPFSKLPIEVRLQIWKYTVLPRLITYRYSSNGIHCTTPTFKPPILYGNRESRKEGLKLYRILNPKESSDACKIYFYPKMDTVLIKLKYNNFTQLNAPITDRESKLLEGLFTPINGIRYVALPWGMFVDMRVRKHYYTILTNLRTLKSVEEITLVRFKKPKKAAKFEVLSMTSSWSLPQPHAVNDFSWFFFRRAWEDVVKEDQRTRNVNFTFPRLRYVEMEYKDVLLY